MTTTAISHAISPSIRPVSSSRRFARRTWAVLAGLVAIFASTMAIDAALHATGVYPPVGQPMGSGLFLLALGYRIACGIGGCWLTARLAPDRPVQHSLVLGGIGVVLSTAGAAALWGAGPAWYPLAVIASVLPCAWIGGALRNRQLRRRGGK